MKFSRPSSSPRPTRRPARRGFTAAELSIGLLVTSLVGAAAAAVALAVSQGWTHAYEVTKSQVTTSRTGQSVEQLMRGARLIGRWRPGSLTDAAAPTASVLLWREDANDDEQVQFDEVSLIEFDPVEKRLVLYEAVFPTEAIAAAANTTFTSPAVLSDADAAEQFRDSIYTPDIGLTPKGELTGACFNVIAANNKGSRPSFEFTLQFKVGGQTTIQYGTATLRSPMP